MSKRIASLVLLVLVCALIVPIAGWARPGGRRGGRGGSGKRDKGATTTATSDISRAVSKMASVISRQATAMSRARPGIHPRPPVVRPSPAGKWPGNLSQPRLRHFRRR